MNVFTSTSLLGVIYGQHAIDHGLHNLVVIMEALSVVLLIETIFDRTLPRGYIG